jgi:putative ABC transport system ATP-binding protein
MIFQQFNLLPFGSVLDNICLPLRFAPTRRARVEDSPTEARRLTDALGLPVDILSAKAATLSVGQQQRVAVARALIGRPPVIIADEPTSALDAGSQSAFLDLLFQQVRADKTALLMVSHDPRLGDRFDRVLNMSEIAQFGRQAA